MINDAMGYRRNHHSINPDDSPNKLRRFNTDGCENVRTGDFCTITCALGFGEALEREFDCVGSSYGVSLLKLRDTPLECNPDSCNKFQGLEYGDEKYDFTDCERSYELRIFINIIHFSILYTYLISLLAKQCYIPLSRRRGSPRGKWCVSVKMGGKTFESHYLFIDGLYTIFFWSALDSSTFQECAKFSMKLIDCNYWDSSGEGESSRLRFLIVLKSFLRALMGLLNITVSFLGTIY